MADVLKEGYFALEDKWYAGLDWLDTHGIPVYKVIDPIDTKIPSMALAGGLLVLGLLFTFFSFGGLFQGGNVGVAFLVVDSESSPLPNIPVQFSYNDTQDETHTSDSLGRIELLVPSGTTIHYQVDLKAYQLIDKSVSAQEGTLEVIQLESLQTQTLTKTIKLVNEVGQPILKEASLTFACSTAYGAAPKPITGSGGTYTVTPNNDCIPFSVSVSVDGYEAVQSYPLTAEKDVYTITLLERTIRDAALNVTVLDSAQHGVSGMDISLQKEGIEVDSGQTGGTGTATFSIAAGEYTVVASDNLNGIYSTAQDTVFVASGQTGNVTLNVTANANATMQVLVIDKTSSNPLKDVLVKLKQGNTVLQTQNTNTEGKANLAVTDKSKTYFVSASKEGYVPQQQSVSGNTSNVNFALERATGTNTAKLFVHLTDQDGDPVGDAKVVLYNADTGFLAPYEGVLSDMNGTAKFNGVSSGNYKAFAYKTSLTAFSNEQFFDIADPGTHDYDIKLEVPDGTVDIHVVDTDGNPVAFAKVSVYNAFKNTLLGADLTDTNGSYQLPRNNQKSKADKDVFVVVSKAGYASVSTIQKPVLPDTVQAFHVLLTPTVPRGTIKIELLGLYTSDSKIVTGVGKGRDYTARYRITIPEEHDNLDEMLVHVRTGEKEIVEKDDWYLTQIKFPRAIVVKGGAWDPSNGVNEDGASITFGPAKWANMVVSGPQPGIYEFETNVRVRESAAAQDILKIFYKVKTQNGDILRDPLDANPTDELYAATKQATYQVGVTTVCDSEFCFDASILDVDEKRIDDVTDSYNAAVFKDYKLTFNLLNNGNAFHTNANLRIKASSDGIQFTTYEIYNADAQLQSGTVNDSEFKAPLPVGNFTPQKKIGGSIRFKPSAAGTTTLTIELVSDFKSVFSKTIQVNATGNKNMKVTVTPDFFPSGIPFEMNIHAEDEATQDDLVHASVVLKTHTGIPLASAETDAAGNATIQLPAQFPGKKIELRVEKGEYNPYVQELSISDQIITLAPAVLGVNINVKTTAEKVTPFTITNASSLPIVVESMEIQGNLKGFLDVEKINASLHQYVGVTIAPNAQLQVNVTSSVTPEGRALAEHDDLDAVIAIQIQNYGSPWAFELPVKYSLGVASEVDNPTCFVAAPNSWTTSTDGKTVTFEFQIQNNCSIAGNPSALKSLAAKAVWNGNEIGETTLTVFEQNNPTAIGAAKVRSGYFSPVLSDLPAQDTLTARLDFVPFGGVKGQGTFDVELQAINPLEGKPQVLTSTISSSIAVVNLSDCVIYDKEILNLQPGKKDTLTIETKGCGAPVRFTLQTELEVPLKEFTLQGSDKKAIEVSDNQLDAGQYPIYVQVEGVEQKLATLNKTIRARITDPNACVQLNRYEFDVFNDPTNPNDGFDTARLDNLCTQQKVLVKVVLEKSFMDSLKKAIGFGVLAFLGTGADNLLNDKPFLGGDEDDPEALPKDAASIKANIGEFESIYSNAQKLASDADKATGTLEDPVLQSKHSLNVQAAKIVLGEAKQALDALQAAIAQNDATTIVQQRNKFVQRIQQVQNYIEQANARMKEDIDKQKGIVSAAPSVPSVASTESADASPATGLTVLFASSIGEKAKDKAINDAVGGGLKGGLGKITDFLSLGTHNPFVAFGVTTLAVAAIDYFTSNEKEYSVEVLGKDVDVQSITMIAGEKGADASQVDTDVKVEKTGIALNPKLNLEKPIVGRQESSTLTFINNSNFRDEALFRNLLVSGKRLVYTPNTKYKNSIPDENKLKSSKTDNFETRIHLQFNSFSPESLASTAVPPIALSCDTFSEKTGKTGPIAAPKVSFEWNFQDIGLNACDQGNTNPDGSDAAVYCDATQFSIELLQKIQLLRSFIEANAPFACPIQDDLSGTETQPIPAADIGISALSVDKTGTTDINVLVTVQNHAPVTNHAVLNVTYTLTGSTGSGTTLTKNVDYLAGAATKIGFPISGLANGGYTVSAVLTPEACENCFNSVPASDSLSSTFFIGAGSGLVACEPFSTKRLDAFIAATEASGHGVNYPSGLTKEKVLALVHFDAKLMQDRFSADFFIDFDRYARKISFFDAPTYYLDQSTGLHRFFTDRSRFIVNREGSPVNPEGYLLPGPGIYDVTLDINFTSQNMAFYQNGVPDATINVYVEKTNTTEDNSPFYSMPFDGLVGTDDGQGRVGYGVNYAGEIVAVNEDASQKVQTVDISNSTPVSNVQASKVDAYTLLNSVERGNILTLTKNGTNQLTLKWSPSFATPVLMTIKGNNAKSSAYGYYSVGVNNDTSQSYIGAKGNPWYGVGPNCRDFQDASLLDSYAPRYDVSGVNADCAIVGAQKNIAYGFEWCENTSHIGSVPLKTIFYTPQGMLSTLTRTAWKDDMTFIGEGVNGGSVPLNGTDGLTHNTPSDQLGSIEDVLNLVKQQAVCVRNSGAKTEFFWNPKEVLNALTAQEKAAEAACIVK